MRHSRRPHELSRLSPSYRLLAALALYCATPVSGQSQEMHVQVQHGKGGSGITGYDHGEVLKKYESTRLRLTQQVVSRADSVCLDVSNAHPVFYSYSLDVSVDTTRERLPDFSRIVAALNPLLGTAARAVPTARGADKPKQLPDWVVRFDSLFHPLGDSIASAQKAIRASDTTANGIKHAIAAVNVVPETPTAGDLQKWFDSTKLNGSPTDTLLRSALKSYGESLIAARTALKATYSSASPAITRCAAVGAGTTTVRLRVKKQVDFAARDIGIIAEVVVNPRYERALVEAFPILLAGFVRDAVSFSLESGVIREVRREDARVYRPGAALLVNLPGSGEAAYGVVAGFGVTSEKKISVSDMFFGLVFSYKDLVRVGVGAGSSEVPIGLKPPASVGGTLQNADDLEKIIVKGDKRAWYLLVAVPGLAVASPWP